MWVLLTAVASASLLGSMHCVGMCGPLAIWASGAGERHRHARVFLATALYHFGRMLTYVLAGLCAGLLGGLVDVGGEVLGVQMVAAKLVGVLMIVLGALRLWSLGSQRKGLVSEPGKANLTTSLLNRLIHVLRPHVLRLPLAARGLTAGLLTALLPCGWLYLFALVAAGTGSVVMGPLVMLAFWIGTVPALVGLVAGTQTLALHFRKLVPAAAALLLIVGGCYTAAGRGFAQLNSLSDIRPQSSLLSPASQASEPRPGTSGAVGSLADENNLGPEDNLAPAGKLDIVAEINRIAETPLPCCEHCLVESQPPEGSPLESRLPESQLQDKSP